ncbi:glucosamine-6-phosphate deaminase [Apibacter sp. HY039]|uniref:glucosamine-6-phosphate deaminase n=1 Tax=Apibacter sp. HY039 TaxID=2501476 RepID=UPI000FEC1630|nr:glucosamine-6-phosphate deaminase [Apibacter sp. HY039]
MRLLIQPNYNSVSYWTAEYIIKEINKAQQKDKKFVLGLPTGSTPLGTYQYLINAYNDKRVSFKDVITFNMDEYVGIAEDHPESYHFFMRKNFFDHIDIQQENINILNGNAEDLEKECNDYEEKIKSVGGIDLFLGGIGPDGHIAFNEPGSSFTSKTRIKTLTEDTIVANSRFFDNDMTKVPKTALTVGVETILSAKEVIIIANGHSKARALAKVIEGGISQRWTVSALQLHPKGIIVCDEQAVYEITVGTYRYFKQLEKDNLINID